MPREGRYAHDYDGLYNARGKRALSKMHRGIQHGDVEKAFREVNELEKNRTEEFKSNE